MHIVGLVCQEEEERRKTLCFLIRVRSISRSRKMLTRLSRFGITFPRLLSCQPARFVSQSKPTGAAGSAAVTELQPTAANDGHGEVSHYVKVSFSVFL